MTALIAVTGGKAHTGQSLLCANLAHYLGSKAHPSAVVAAGPGPFPWEPEAAAGFQDVMIDASPPIHLRTQRLFDVDLFHIAPGGHAGPGLNPLPPETFFSTMQNQTRHAYLLADLPPGISSPTLACCMAAIETLVVVTTDTASLNGAYEMLAALGQRGYTGRINLVFNQVRRPALAQTAFARFRDLAQRRLRLQVNLWGAVSWEEKLEDRGIHSRPLSQGIPESRVLREIQGIGDRLLAEQPPENQTLSLGTFWQRYRKLIENQPGPAPAAVTPASPAMDPPAAATHEPPLSPAESAEPRDPAAQPAPGPEQEPTLNRLAGHLESIARELGAIRRILEETRGSQSKPAGSGAEDGDRIFLDFETYIKNMIK